ncbi:MAG TPA: hypothetical protein VFM14_04105 [Gemmatimonadales bacterium]|nr:hypothetical protein [Gemmatimonadales bacterium]
MNGSGKTSRSGVTPVELAIGLVITAIIGAGLVTLLRGEIAFVGPHGSRSTVNPLLSDIRMLEATGGLDPATASGRDFTLRVPYAFGLVCGSNGTVTTLSLLPADSSRLAEGASGFAWHDAVSGVYTYVTAAPTITSPGTTATCTRVGIGTVPASSSSPPGRVVNLIASVSPAPTAGSVLFLYRRVRYEFRASASVPGRDGLWRTVDGQTDQELAAPLDTGARAAFFVLNRTPAETTLPTPLSSVRGLEIRLGGSDGTISR